MPPSLPRAHARVRCVAPRGPNAFPPIVSPIFLHCTLITFIDLRYSFLPPFRCPRGKLGTARPPRMGKNAMTTARDRLWSGSIRRGRHFAARPGQRTTLLTALPVVLAGTLALTLGA